jgi:integrase
MGAVMRPLVGPEVQRMQEYLSRNYMPRYRLIFEIALETGLRIGDIVRLERRTASKREWVVVEAKTNKQRLITPSRALQGMIRRNAGAAPPYEPFLFFSMKTRGKHVTREQVYRVFNGAAKKLGLAQIGPHTLRKTFATRYFAETGDIKGLQELMNHKYASTTILYLYGHLAYKA